MKRKLFVSAGEASGDLHAAGLVSELNKLNPDITAWGLGGDRLQSEGVEILHHTSSLSTMGFAEVVRKLPFFRRVITDVTHRFASDAPDAAILVDYPGMNFKFAERLNTLGIPFVYYVLPQVWAWHSSRIEKMKRWNARFVSILPFEPEFYSQHGLDVQFYGHPLVDLAKPDCMPSEFRASVSVADSEKLIAVLPGSRHQEITRILPVVLSSLKIVQETVGNLKILCKPVSRSQNDMFSEIIGRTGIRAEIFSGNIYDLLSAADLTLVASGTATVEAAICGSPAIVLYRTNWLTYLIAKRLIKVPYIGMANIIAGEELYPELIQSDVNPTRITAEITRFLQNPAYIRKVKSGAAKIRNSLGEGNAYEKAAIAVSSYLFS